MLVEEGGSQGPRVSRSTWNLVWLAALYSGFCCVDRSPSLLSSHSSTTRRSDIVTSWPWRTTYASS